MADQEHQSSNAQRQDQTVDIDAIYDQVFGPESATVKESAKPIPSIAQKKYVLTELHSDEIKAHFKLPPKAHIYVFDTNDKYTERKASEFAELLKTNEVQKGRMPFSKNQPSLVTTSGEIICSRAEYIKVGFAPHKGQEILVLYTYFDQAPSSDVLDTGTTAETVSLSAGDTQIESAPPTKTIDSPSSTGSPSNTGKIPEEVRARFAPPKAKDSRSAAADILDKLRRGQ